MAQREGSVTLYLFVATFILFVLMFVLFVIQKAALDDVTTKYDVLVKGVSKGDVAPLNQVLAQSQRYLEERNKLRQLIAGPDADQNWPGDEFYSDRLKESQDRFNEIRTQLGLSQPQYDSLYAPYGDFLTLIEELKKQKDNSTSQSQIYLQQYQELQAKNKVYLTELEDKLADRGKANSELERQFEQKEFQYRQRIDELTAQSTQKEEESFELERRLRNELAFDKNEIRKLTSRLEEIQLQIRRDKNIEDIEPDGQLLEVESSTNVAWLDRGRKHHLRPGLSFRVFHYIGGKKQFKGEVEVIQIDEDMSRVRITKQDDAFNPIAPNDYVTSPFYDPKKSPVFVFAGTELASQDVTVSYVRRKLQDYGAEIRDKVDIHTDFVVALKDYDSTGGPQYDAARELGVTIIRENDLLEYLGR